MFEELQVGGIRVQALITRSPVSFSVNAFRRGEHTDMRYSIGVIGVDSWPGDRGRWWLARLRVYPEYQRMGFGGWMVKLAMDHVRQQHGFRVFEVAPGGYGSDPGQLDSFYRKQGFELTNEPGLLAWHGSVPNVDSEALDFGAGETE